MKVAHSLCIVAGLLILPCVDPAAQAAIRVRVPVSLINDYSPGGCTVQSKARTDSAATKDGDTLTIAIENDRMQAVAAGRLLAVRIGDLSPHFPADSSTLAVKGPLVGKVLLISREADDALVCAVLLPALPEEKQSARGFRVGVGASFDFLRGLSSTDLYYDVNIFLPDVWKGRSGSWGVDAGLYNGRSVARDTSSRRRPIFWHIPPGATDTEVTRIRATASSRIGETIDVLGVYAGPTYRIEKDIYLVIHAEMLRRDAVRTVTTTISVDDTTTIPRDPELTYPDSARAVTLDTLGTNRRLQNLVFFGAGLIVRVEREKIEFHTKQVLAYSAYDFVGGDARWNLISQFRITDFSSGFKLGGEVRTPLDRVAPAILLYLAKDFGFKRMAEFLVKGDGQ